MLCSVDPSPGLLRKDTGKDVGQRPEMFLCTPVRAATGTWRGLCSGVLGGTRSLLRSFGCMCQEGHLD